MPQNSILILFSKTQLLYTGFVKLCGILQGVCVFYEAGSHLKLYFGRIVWVLCLDIPRGQGSSSFSFPFQIPILWGLGLGGG